MNRLTLALGLFVVVLPIAAISAACGGSSNGTTTIDINREPIAALAGSASQEAANMERHATDMEAAAAGRPDAAEWIAEAATLRANAQSMQFMSSSAMAIYRDRGAHPATAVELTRVFGDGVNLHLLGEMVIDHADAMQAHADVMRERAAGDEALLAAVDALVADNEAMRAAGQGAIDRGTELQNEAQRLADTVGVELPSGGEHEDS